MACNEFLVEIFIPEDHVRHSQRKDSHAAGPDLYPFRCVSAGLGHARVHVHHLQARSGPIFFQFPVEAVEIDRGRGRLKEVCPEREKVIGFFQVEGKGGEFPERLPETEFADARSPPGEKVGRAHAGHKIPGKVREQRVPVSDEKPETIGLFFLQQPLKPLGYAAESFFPRDGLPGGFSLFSFAAHGLADPVGVIEQFQSSLPHGTDEPAVDRCDGIAENPDRDPVDQTDPDAAPRRALAAGGHLPCFDAGTVL